MSLYNQFSLHRTIGSMRVLNKGKKDISMLRLRDLKSATRINWTEGNGNGFQKR